MGNQLKLHYIKGHCEIETGVVQFEGDVRAVSREQAWYNIIYELRRRYNIDYWINPIVEDYKISSSNTTHIKHEICNNFKCVLIPYANGEIKTFNKLNSKYKPDDILPDFDRMEKEQIDEDSCDADFMRRMSIETKQVVRLEDTITKKLLVAYSSLEGLLFKYSYRFMKMDKKEYLSKYHEYVNDVKDLNAQLDSIAELRNCTKYYHKLNKHVNYILNRVKVYTDSAKDKETKEDMLVCINNLENRSKEYFTKYHESVIDNL